MSLEVSANIYQPLRKGIQWNENEFLSYNLPEDQYISQIVITADLTASGGTSNAINPNAFLKFVKVALNGQTIEEWDGEVKSNAATAGIRNLRLLNAVLNGIEDKDNVIVVDLQKFGPLPSGAKKTLELQMNSVSNTTDDGTAVTGTISIYYLTQDPDEEWLARIIKREKVELGNSSSYTHRPIQCPASYQCSFMILSVDNAGTYSDTVISNILIKKNETIIRNVEWQLLQNSIQTVSKYTLPTGGLVIDMDELEWKSDELEVEFTTSGASDVTVNIHYVFTRQL